MRRMGYGVIRFPPFAIVEYASTISRGVISKLPIEIETYGFKGDVTPILRA